MKRVVFCLGLAVISTGFLVAGTGCGTLLKRENGQAPVVFGEPVKEAAQPVAETAVAESNPAPQAVASAPVGGEPKGKPWYRRMFRRNPAPAAATNAAAVEASAPAEAAPAALQEKVLEAKEAEPAATNAPAKRSWYRFWKRSEPKAVPAEDPVAKPAVVETNAAAVTAVAGTNAPAAEASAPAKRPWYRFWGGAKAPKKGPAGGNEPKPPEPLPEKGLFSASGEPLIKPGYSLRMSVSAGGKVEMAEQVKTVSDKGDITLPLIETVACEGMTVQELSDQIEKLYAQFVRNPQASVEFVYSDRPGEISPWGAVVVYGQVRNPGRVNIPPTRDLTLSRAIQFSGGAKDEAKQSAIEVTRHNKDGSKKRIVIDLEAAAKRGEIEKDIILQHGDMINVPRSTW